MSDEIDAELRHLIETEPLIAGFFKQMGEGLSREAMDKVWALAKQFDPKTIAVYAIVEVDDNNLALVGAGDGRIDIFQLLRDIANLTPQAEFTEEYE